MSSNSFKNVVVIEGFSGVGKTSTAQALALEIDYCFIDSGLLYRSFCLHLIRHHIELVPKEVFKAFLNFEPLIANDGSVTLEGHDVTSLLHDKQVTSIVSLVSGAFFVRKRINQIIKDFCLEREGKVIVTGRSTAQEVFPETKLIFDLQARAKVRARRRYLQKMADYQGEGVLPDYEEILTSLKLRDQADMEKEVMPMVLNEQACVVNTEKLNLEDVVEIIAQEIRKDWGLREGELNMRRSKER